MTVVALASIAGNVLLVLGFLRYAQTSARPYTRREDVLIDKIMHLAGRTWTPPPAAEAAALDAYDEDRFASMSSDLDDFGS